MIDDPMLLIRVWVMRQQICDFADLDVTDPDVAEPVAGGDVVVMLGYAVVLLL